LLGINVAVIVAAVAWNFTICNQLGQIRDQVNQTTIRDAEERATIIAHFDGAQDLFVKQYIDQIEMIDDKYRDIAENAVANQKLQWAEIYAMRERIDSALTAIEKELGIQ